MKSIGIIDYGLNNLSSIYYMIKNLNYKPQLIDKNENQKLDVLIIPGVGSYYHGMKNLKNKGFDNLIYDHVGKGKMLIAICLGYQFLFKKSYEFGTTAGLGLLNGEIVPFNSDCTTPNIGWSKLDSNILNKYCSNNVSDTIKEKYFYHVHSYYPDIKDKNIILSFSFNNKLKFPSAICYKNIYGFQFHPEKSGINGQNLLMNILN